MPISTRNITKETVTHLDPAPRPEPGQLLEIRSGKITRLGHETSGIFKKVLAGRQFIGYTGIASDEHVYSGHGGVDRALNQYASEHYTDWRDEGPKPELFEYGGFGENLVGTNLSEENVCIGDLFQIGNEVVVQVSEPRSPCSKLNIRFDWPRALKRIQRTARVGWNYRVIKTGYIEAGDSVELLERPNPKWSLLNVKRVIQGKHVSLTLLSELADLKVLTEIIRGYAQERLLRTPKRYELVQTREITSRVKEFRFALKEPVHIMQPDFQQFAFAQIDFGNEGKRYKRSYSIVSGDLNAFCLGVARDDESRGGSIYLHNNLRRGNEVIMTLGTSPKAVEDEERCISERCLKNRVVIIGGIGVTAFLPLIKQWDEESIPYEIHYAVRSPEQAAYLSNFLPDKAKIYAKSRGERLNIAKLIPAPTGINYVHKIYCCGPTSLMDAVEQRALELGYPEHMLHFESFGVDAGGRRGDPFVAQIEDLDTGRKEILDVPGDMTLLQVLKEAGFDMTSFCESGGCGACKVEVCSGKVKHNGSGLKKTEIEGNILSCVDRGLGTIQIQLD